MITYNQIVEAFENIVKAHKQLGTGHFFFGDPTDWQALQDLVMPQILLQPIPSQGTKDSFKYKFRLFYLDIIEADNSNLRDVYSDSLLVLNDILNLLNYGTLAYDIVLNLALTYNPFSEKFDDLTAGHWVEIEIAAYRLDNKCAAPTL